MKLNGKLVALHNKVLRMVDAESKAIAAKLGLANYYVYGTASGDTLTIRTLTPTKEIPAPIAVLWDEVERARFVEAWKAENDPAVLERAELAKLLAKYGPNCEACREVSNG
jgi:hypothetical protein